MLNFLDLLVIVFLVILVIGAVSAFMMFFVKNTIIRKICFYVVEFLGIYSAYIGIRIGASLINSQYAVGICVGVAGIAALVIECMNKGDEKKFMIARIISVVAFVIGIFNAFM